MRDPGSIDRLLQDAGFHAPRTITGRSSVADLYRTKRCGIYVLHFSNGDYYVGQTMNVVRRFSQHKHTHPDIEKISFKRVAKHSLNMVEKQVVKALEQADATLRNIDLVTLPATETDFDLIMPEDDQQKWLDDLTYNDLIGDRAIDPDLRRRYHARYQHFLDMPFVEDVMRILRYYVHTCIPAAKRSEIAFWMCSCLPGDSKNLYARINVGWQTAFDAFLHDGAACFRWYLTRELAEIVTGNSLAHLQDGFEYKYTFAKNGNQPDTPFFVANSSLAKGGQDQVVLIVEDKTAALALLADELLRAAVRYFNLGLVKKGPSPWGKNHCLDLADHFFEPLAV